MNEKCVSACNQAIVINEQTLHSNFLPQEDVIYDPNYWHMIIVNNVRNQSRDEIMESIMRTAGTDEFFPSCYTVNDGNVSFLLKDPRVVIALLNQNLTVYHLGMNRNYEPFKITVVLRFASIIDVAVDYKSILYPILRKRYDAGMKLMDLDAFHKDEDLWDYFPLCQQSVLSVVLKLCRHFEVHSLKLGNNNLESLQSLENLQSIRCLDLRRNKISSAKQLAVLKGFTIIQLILEENPICANMPESEYLKSVRLYCPKIIKLDGCLVPSIGMPTYHKNYLWRSDCKPLIDQFLEHYFTLYDSENRKMLEGLYHSSALFSLTAHFPDKGVYKSLRNLKVGSNMFNPNDYLFVGPTSILRVLGMLPKTLHDPYSFTVDMPYYTPNCVIFTVNGIFKESGESLLDSEAFYSFSRTFALSSLDGREYSIINEQLHVTNASEVQQNSAFVHVKVPESGIIRVPQAITDRERDELLVAFCNLTDLKSLWGRKCLEECEYDIKHALNLFVSLMKNDKIPSCALRAEEYGEFLGASIVSTETSKVRLLLPSSSAEPIQTLHHNPNNWQQNYNENIVQPKMVPNVNLGVNYVQSHITSVPITQSRPNVQINMTIAPVPAPKIEVLSRSSMVPPASSHIKGRPNKIIHNKISPKKGLAPNMIQIPLDKTVVPFKRDIVSNIIDVNKSSAVDKSPAVKKVALPEKTNSSTTLLPQKTTSSTTSNQISKRIQRFKDEHIKISDNVAKNSHKDAEVASIDLRKKITSSRYKFVRKETDTKVNTTTNRSRNDPPNKPPDRGTKNESNEQSSNNRQKTNDKKDTNNKDQTNGVQINSKISAAETAPKDISNNHTPTEKGEDNVSNPISEALSMAISTPLTLAKEKLIKATKVILDEIKEKPNLKNCRLIAKEFYKRKLFVEGRKFLDELTACVTPNIADELYMTFALLEMAARDLKQAETMITRIFQKQPVEKSIRFINGHITVINKNFARQMLRNAVNIDIPPEKVKGILTALRDFETKHGNQETLKMATDLAVEFFERQKGKEDCEEVDLTQEKSGESLAVEEPMDLEDDVISVHEEAANLEVAEPAVAVKEIIIPQQVISSRPNRRQRKASARMAKGGCDLALLRTFRTRLLIKCGVLPVKFESAEMLAYQKSKAAMKCQVGCELMEKYPADVDVHRIVCIDLWSRKHHNKVLEWLNKNTHSEILTIKTLYKTREAIAKRDFSKAIEILMQFLKTAHLQDMAWMIEQLVKNERSFITRNLAELVASKLIPAEKCEILKMQMASWHMLGVQFTSNDLNDNDIKQNEIFHPDDVLASQDCSDFRTQYSNTPVGTFPLKTIISYIHDRWGNFNPMVEGTRALYFHGYKVPALEQRNLIFPNLNSVSKINYLIALSLFETLYGSATLGIKTLVQIPQNERDTVNVRCAFATCNIKMNNFDRARSTLDSIIKDLHKVMHPNVQKGILKFYEHWVYNFDCDLFDIGFQHFRNRISYVL